MKVTVKTPFVPLVFDLRRDAPEGVAVEVPPVGLSRDLGAQDIALAIITLAASVPVNIFSSWLERKLSGRKPVQISVNGKEVSGDVREVLRVIEEEMRLEQGLTLGDKPDA